MPLPLPPWDVREEHRDSPLHRMLERESLRREGMPCGTQEDLGQLEEWKARLAELGAVVDYRPTLRRGFFLVYATEAERGQLIRRPGV